MFEIVLALGTLQIAVFKSSRYQTRNVRREMSMTGVLFFLFFFFLRCLLVSVNNIKP